MMAVNMVKSDWVKSRREGGEIETLMELYECGYEIRVDLERVRREMNWRAPC